LYKQRAELFRRKKPRGRRTVDYVPKKIRRQKRKKKGERNRLGSVHNQDQLDTEEREEGGERKWHLQLQIERHDFTSVCCVQPSLKKIDSESIRYCEQVAVIIRDLVRLNFYKIKAGIY
jgi:hypothetical protein